MLTQTDKPDKSSADSAFESGAVASFVAAQLAPLIDAHVAVGADKAALLKAGEKLQAGLLKIAGDFDSLSFSSATLASARTLATVFHSLAVESVKAGATVSANRNAADLAKVAYKALFTSEVPLVLSEDEAQLFLEFVVDVICASKAGTLTQDGPLPSAQSAEVESLGTYLNLVTGAMNTHDAKSAHSSARLEVAAPNEPKASRFLNSSAFAPVISARASGGSLRDAPWLERVNCCVVTIAGKTFTLLEALCSTSIRGHLLSSGVTAFALVPLAVPQSSGGYSGQFVGQTRLKMPGGAASVALNLVPSNAMLKATAQLGARVAEISTAKLATIYREHLLHEIPVEHQAEIAEAFPFEEFIPAAEFSPNQGKLVKAINQHLKKLKVAQLPEQVLQFAWKVPAPNRIRQGRHVVRVPVVSSQPQNCGGAYCSFAGSKGPFRFPAAPLIQERRAAKEERSFYVANKLLAESLRESVEAQSDYKSLEEKYQIGEKWLPQRVQRAMQRSQLQGAVSRYLRLLARLVRRVKLSEEQKSSLTGFDECAIQSYLIYGAETPDPQLEALAAQGTALLKSGDRALHAQFIKEVVAQLKEELK